MDRSREVPRESSSLSSSSSPLISSLKEAEYLDSQTPFVHYYGLVPRNSKCTVTPFGLSYKPDPQEARFVASQLQINSLGLKRTDVHLQRLATTKRNIIIVGDPTVNFDFYVTLKRQAKEELVDLDVTCTEAVTEKDIVDGDFFLFLYYAEKLGSVDSLREQIYPLLNNIPTLHLCSAVIIMRSREGTMTLAESEEELYRFLYKIKLPSYTFFKYGEERRRIVCKCIVDDVFHSFGWRRLYPYILDVGLRTSCYDQSAIGDETLRL